MQALAIKEYKSGKEAVDAFLAGHDFIISDLFGKYAKWDGKRFSIRNCEPGTAIELRYGHFNSQVTMVVVPEHDGEDQV